MKRVARPVASRSSEMGIGYSGEFLEHLARILVDAGHSPKKLAREFREICSALPEPARQWNPEELNYAGALGHVIACWHDDPQFLDSRGEPIALPVRSSGPCLRSLIARALPMEKPGAVIESLIRARGIRRRGTLYVPTGRQLLFPRQSSSRVHGLMSLLGMLRTVEHNASCAGLATRIVERTAVNPRFPVRALPAFHRWLKRSASKFLWNTDGSMRRRQWESLAGPTLRLGVGVFAFEDPLTSGRSIGRKRGRPDRRHRRVSRGK
ncbi:MAG TPA: hypothetical protein VNX02_11355 [Steroidobacteraceae bacterium]|nr:hypothetical protein [Steroidobacteraceae bacterium]